MANLPFTREQLISLGFDPDKAVEVMSAPQAPKPPLVMHPEYQPIPVEAKKELAQPVKAKPLPKLSLQDKQADAMAALEVMDEQQKAQPEPLPQLPQISQAPVPQQEDTISRYMNMLDQIKRDEKAALEAGKKDLDSARNRDTLASTFANIAGIWGQAHGGKFSGKDLYNGNVGANAEKDYAELLRQLQQKKTDASNDLSSLGSLQKIRSGDSDFKSSEQFRDPASEVSQLYRDQYKKLNPDVPISNNLSAEAVSKLITASKKASGEMTPYQSAMLDLMKRKADQADKRIGQAEIKEDRLAEMFMNSKVQKDELSDKQTESIASFDRVLDFSNTLKPKFEAVKQKLGPYASKAENFKEMIPYLEKDPEFVQFQADVADNLSQYVKSISGLTVSDKERAQLEQAAPKITDKPGEFLAKLDGFKKRLEQFKKTELDTYRKYQGKNVQGYSSTPSDMDNKIESFMRKNNIQDKNQAIEILKKAGKI